MGEIVSRATGILVSSVFLFVVDVVCAKNENLFAMPSAIRLHPHPHFFLFFFSLLHWFLPYIPILCTTGLWGVLEVH